MPVNGTRVTTLYVYALPGPPQSFSAKSASTEEAVSTSNHQQLRMWRNTGQLGMRCFLFLLWTSLIAQAQQPLPATEGLTSWGCSVSQQQIYRSNKHEGLKWVASVWAEHGEDNRDWQMTWSVRDKMDKAVDDCKDFIKAIRKKLNGTNKRKSPKNPS